MGSRRRALKWTAGALTAGGLVSGVGWTVSQSSRRTASATPSVLVAGSLKRIADEVGGASVEAHGSVACRRLVVAGARDPDALALADPTLFDGLADRVTLFATNALVVAYHPDSPHADAVRADWRAAVTDPDITVGRTDPEKDPLGYRTVMALRLADGVDAETALDSTEILPEVGLVRALAGGSLDAAFAYRNMAVEHDLPTVDLPSDIDFSTPARAETYAAASVDLGDRTVRGAPIRYGAAALTDRGASWVERLTTATADLEASGFSVPDSYPTAEPAASVGGQDA